MRFTIGLWCALISALVLLLGFGGALTSASVISDQFVTNHVRYFLSAIALFGGAVMLIISVVHRGDMVEIH